MLSKKFLLTLMGLLVAVFAICNVNLGQDTVEGWWGGGNPSFTWKAMPAIKKKDGSFVATGGNFVGSLSDSRFIKTPQFQGILSPRFNNNDYGANIRYNMTDYENQAVPCNPLTFGDMAKENYTQQTKENYPTSCGSGSCSGGCSPQCGKGGMPVPYHGSAPEMPAGYAAGDYNKVMEKVYSESDHPAATDSLPIGTMTSINSEGEVTQPVVFSRFMYANRQSRLRAQGDPIRGDLPIVPCNLGWFSVAPNVNIDLQEGAMNVLGGTSNQTSSALSQLIYDASGNADTTIGGVNLADANMTPQYTGQYSAIGDVQISAMP